MGNGTSLGRARGLGSAHEGHHHWLLQRFTAIGNVMLMLWLTVSILLLPDMHYATVANWLSAPVPAAAMILLIVSTFWHARLGLQVAMEDYIKTPGNRFACLALLNIAAIGGGIFGVLCIVRLALGGAA